MKSAKGADFERSLAKRLSLWWTKGERDDIFWRSQQSGGRATQRKKQGKATANQEGDLTVMDAAGQPFIDKIVVEAKCGYPSFSIEGEINKTAEKTVFKDFINQCLKEVGCSERFFWLIVKQDRKKEIVLVPFSFITFVRSKGNNKLRKNEYLEIHLNDHHLVCFRLQDFLSNISPEDLL